MQNTKVLAMGNPIITPSVKELYLHIVTGKSKEKTDNRSTELAIDKTLLDFGKFSKHDKQTGEIVITNLTVHYEAEEVGYFNKTIDIYSNTGISPIKVQIKGETLPN